MAKPVSVGILRAAICQSWQEDTSADPDNWSLGNPAWGQCADTALVVNDFLKGELVRLELTSHKEPKVAAMRSHYFNRVNGEDLDLSISQFEDSTELKRVMSLQETTTRERSDLLENEDTKKRYLSLRLRVARLLSGNSPLFEDEMYRRCLSLALLSNCQKGKYGCVVKYHGVIIGEACNKILEPLKGWCEPQCIRLDIPARTNSMIGCCAHAEEIALTKTRDLGLDLSQCEFYVAGFRSSGLTYLKPDRDFTCIRCAVQLYLHNVGKVFVPMADSWEYLTSEEAISTAKQYATQDKKVENYSTT